MRRVAIGDPQAPFSTFLAILRHHGLLAANGRLADDVQLVSIGDNFDWGHQTHREEATREARQLLEWLASHPPEQAIVLAGNHDLARVAELLSFSDADWQQVRAEADEVARSGGEEAFLARHPELPKAQVASRDFATFDVAQRDLVLRLLEEGRYRLAFAPQANVLLTHAGVTIDDLEGIDVPATNPAPVLADKLNEALDDALAQWNRKTAFAIPRLHRPGSAADGEARGILFHRPANPDAEQDPQQFAGPLQRRYDARRLPAGLTQAVGHIRDNKCRTLLGDWADGAPAMDGPLRSLRVRDGVVSYRHGIFDDRRPDDATMLFLDGGMAHARVEEYQLLDLDRLQAIMPPSTTMAAPLM